MNRINDYSDSITLDEWLLTSYDESMVSTLLVNMDSAMKYIHNKGFVITSFNPKDIDILNDSIEQIRFDRLAPLDSDYGIQMNEAFRKNIFSLSDLAIGIRCRFPDRVYINEQFLRDNFNLFEMYLPVEDVPYYKGVIERGAGVYYCDFLVERRKRELEALEKEIDGDNSSNYSNSNSIGGKTKVYSNGHSILGNYDSTNRKVNDSIYGQLGKMGDGAHISFFVVPIVVALLGAILAVLVLISQI